MKIPELHVKRAKLALDHPWTNPPGVERVDLIDSSTGEPCRLRTQVAVFQDDDRLLVQFSMEDEEIIATMYDRDSELWREDVVEIFLAADSEQVYFEFEVSPRGTLFDARVIFPGPTRETMTVDRTWRCPGFHAAVKHRRIQPGSFHLEILAILPFECLPVGRPRTGDCWRANFYRIDRSERGDLFAAWSPTLTRAPDFHVPGRFGRLVF